MVRTVSIAEEVPLLMLNVVKGYIEEEDITRKNGLPFLRDR